MKTFRFCLGLCGLFFLTQNLHAVVGGNIEVTILPAAAVTQGAQWQVDSDPLEPSGTNVQVSQGGHTVSFTTIAGWNTPTNQSVTATALQTNFLIGTYTVAFTYITNSDNTLTITGPSTAGGPLVIPSTISNMTVTAIGAGAFYNLADVTSVVIPDTVTVIETNAFAEDSALTNVVFGNGLTNIEDRAFFHCGLGSAILPDSLLTVGSNAFAFSSLETLSLGTNVTTLADGAFEDTALTNVVIPSSATNIGPNVFESCESLVSATISSNLPTTGSYTFYKCGDLTNLVLEAGLQKIGDGAFDSTGLTTVVVPDSAKNIGDNAFLDAPLANIVIGGGVTNIGASAFSETSLQAAFIPGNVINIGTNAFQNCEYLTNLVISNGVRNISPNAFDNCEYLMSAIVPGSVTNIDDDAFAFCGRMTNVSLGEGLETIGDAAFEDCSNLHNIYIPDSVTFIGDVAFVSCYRATNIHIPASLQSLGSSTFSGCTNLLDITLRGPITNMGSGEFSGCSALQNVVFEEGPTVIGNGMFSGDQAITNLELSDTITNIESGAFGGCANISSLIVPGSVSVIGSAAFGGCTDMGPIYFLGNAPVVPDNSSFGGAPGPGIYFPGATGWSNYLGGPGGLRMIELLPPSGGVQVFLTPTNILASGAAWQVDGGASMTNGALVTNLSYGEHILSFAPVSGYVTPALQAVSVLPGTNTVVTVNYTTPPGSLKVVIGPVGAINAGAQWLVNGGSFQNSGAILTNIPSGTAVVSFASVPGWITPASEDVTVTQGQTATLNVLYVPSNAPAGNIVLLTNGAGGIQTPGWPTQLVVGKKYTAKAVPAAGNLFVNWVGGVVPGPQTILSTSASYSFYMRSNLVLEANFVTNIFALAQGAYNGLFAPTNTDRTQTNSGAFTLSVSSAGAASGKLSLGAATTAFTGKFDSTGTLTFTSKQKGAASLTTTLQLAGSTVSGTVTDGSFVAQLTGYQDPFSAKNKTTAYAGKYTLIIPGTTNPAVGPYGVGYGTVTVSVTGGISFSGSLADGTAVSQSSAISADGYWPMYISLYGGKGSLWSWNYFTNQTVSNDSAGSWINTTNTVKTALYRSGFTNQAAAIEGAIYSTTNQPLLDLTNAEIILDGGDSFYLTNEITLSTANKITITGGDTNKLSLSINKTTGVISGGFANPSNPKQTIKINGVLLQNETNAQGYFLGTNQSGAFLLTPR